jgi:homoserine kinase
VQVAGILTRNVQQLGQALNSDVVVEAARGPLIPGFAAVKEAALKAGAFGCTISGAGPTVVAVVDDDEVGQAVGHAMANAFRSAGGLEINSVQVAALDSEGVRLI